MGQDEIYHFLKKHKGKWFSTKEIASSLEVNSGSVTRAAKRLRCSGFIRFKEDYIGSRRRYLYSYGKGIPLY